MSRWSELGLTDKVVQILADVDDGGHHFGRPYLSAYQLAIEVQDRFPDDFDAIGKPIGGSGTGQQDSLSQYLANELSKQIKAQGSAHPVEGAFLSNEHATQVSFRSTAGEDITSSLVGGGFSMSLFRLR